MPPEPLTSRLGSAGQHQRFLFAAVVVGAEIDGFLVDVGQHFVGNLGQADFGVTHGGGVVAVHRTEVALAVHQHVAQEKSCAMRTMVSYTDWSPCGWYLPITSPTIRADFL